LPVVLRAVYCVRSRDGGVGDVVDDADALVLNSVGPRDHHRPGVAPDRLREVMIPVHSSAVRYA